MPSERFAQALKLAEELPVEERAELAHELNRSLPEDMDDFDREIERRRRGPHGHSRSTP